MRTSRRRFLQGAFGAAVGIPLLESLPGLRGGRALAAAPETPVYTFFMRQGNGVQQGSGGEPETFWPTQTGTLTSATMANRAVGVLSAYANKLNIVTGTRFGFPGVNCGHAQGINQVLTAQRPVGSGNTSLSAGESIDWFLARQLNPDGRPPLTLMSGPEFAYIAHGLSYSGPQQLRGAQNNPFAAYQDLMGLGGAPPELQQQIALRRKSVNDLVRGEMQDLMSKSYLSGADRTRLTTHFEAIRDFEVQMGCLLTDGEVMAMETIQAAAVQNNNRIAVAEMMVDLVALAFACDATRTATLQIGDGNDQTRYYVNGQLIENYHTISHREVGNSVALHHEVDKVHGRVFLRMLEKLNAAVGPSGGTLLDDSVCLWTNDLANGPPHSYNNIPQVLAGSAGGFLRTGQFIDAGGVTHNRLLNTIISACGFRNSNGDNYDSFGDASLSRGVIDAMIA